MPFKVRCHNCGQIIHQSDDIKTPDEIIQKFDGRCPKCSKKLSHKPFDVKISPVEKRRSETEKHGR